MPNMLVNVRDYIQVSFSSQVARLASFVNDDNGALIALYLHCKWTMSILSGCFSCINKRKVKHVALD